MVVEEKNNSMLTFSHENIIHSKVEIGGSRSIGSSSRRRSFLTKFWEEFGQIAASVLRNPRASHRSRSVVYFE